MPNLTPDYGICEACEACEVVTIPFLIGCDIHVHFAHMYWSHMIDFSVEQMPSLPAFTMYTVSCTYLLNQYIAIESNPLQRYIFIIKSTFFYEYLTSLARSAADVRFISLTKEASTYQSFQGINFTNARNIQIHTIVHRQVCQLAAKLLLFLEDPLSTNAIF
jgi:hypothetical protein